MVVLVDTNVVLDFILKREPFYDMANMVLAICTEPDNEGFIALHSVTTIFYVLRKLPDKIRRQALLDICCVLEVAGTTHSEVISAIENSDFKDFEDCIQSKCAKSVCADYIVTRNKVDFEFSEIPSILPVDFVSMFKR